MTPPPTFATSARLTACGAVLLVLTLVAMAGTVSGQQAERSSGSDATRIRRTAPSDVAARQRFLAMFARAYFPGRTGQLLIVPREGDFITRPDPDVAYMHGSPWAYWCPGALRAGLKANGVSLLKSYLSSISTNITLSPPRFTIVWARGTLTQSTSPTLNVA